MRKKLVFLLVLSVFVSGFSLTTSLFAQNTPPPPFKCLEPTVGPLTNAVAITRYTEALKKAGANDAQVQSCIELCKSGTCKGTGGPEEEKLTPTNPGSDTGSGETTPTPSEELPPPQDTGCSNGICTDDQGETWEDPTYQPPVQSDTGCSNGICTDDQGETWEDPTYDKPGEAPKPYYEPEGTRSPTLGDVAEALNPISSAQAGDGRPLSVGVESPLGEYTAEQMRDMGYTNVEDGKRYGFLPMDPNTVLHREDGSTVTLGQHAAQSGNPNITSHDLWQNFEPASSDVAYNAFDPKTGNVVPASSNLGDLLLGYSEGGDAVKMVDTGAYAGVINPSAPSTDTPAPLVAAQAEPAFSPNPLPPAPPSAAPANPTAPTAPIPQAGSAEPAPPASQSPAPTPPVIERASNSAQNAFDTFAQVFNPAHNVGTQSYGSLANQFLGNQQSPSAPSIPSSGFGSTGSSASGPSFGDRLYNALAEVFPLPKAATAQPGRTTPPTVPNTGSPILMTGVTTDYSHNAQVASFKAGYQGPEVKAFSNSDLSGVLAQIEASRGQNVPVVLFSGAAKHTEQVVRAMQAASIPLSNLKVVEPYNSGGATTQAVRNAVNLGLDPRNVITSATASERGAGIVSGSTQTPDGANHLGSLAWAGSNLPATGQTGQPVASTGQPTGGQTTSPATSGQTTAPSTVAAAKLSYETQGAVRRHASPARLDGKSPAEHLQEAVTRYNQKHGTDYGVKVISDTGPVGSRRHRHVDDNGCACAVDAAITDANGRELPVTDPVYREVALDWAATTRGGVGFGSEYMSGTRMHVDFVQPEMRGKNEGMQWKSGAEAMAGALDAARAAARDSVPRPTYAANPTQRILSTTLNPATRISTTASLSRTSGSGNAPSSGYTGTRPSFKLGSPGTDVPDVDMKDAAQLPPAERDKLKVYNADGTANKDESGKHRSLKEYREAEQRRAQNEVDNAALAKRLDQQFGPGHAVTGSGDSRTVTRNGQPAGRIETRTREQVEIAAAALANSIEATYRDGGVYDQQGRKLGLKEIAPSASPVSDKPQVPQPNEGEYERMIRMTYAECGGKASCMQGVAETIRNRVIHGLQRGGRVQSYSNALMWTDESRYGYYQSDAGNKARFASANPGTPRYAAAKEAVDRALGLAGHTPSNTTNGALHNWGPRCACESGAISEMSRYGIKVAGGTIIGNEYFYTKPGESVDLNNYQGATPQPTHQLTAVDAQGQITDIGSPLSTNVIKQNQPSSVYVTPQNTEVALQDIAPGKVEVVTVVTPDNTLALDYRFTPPASEARPYRETRVAQQPRRSPAGTINDGWRRLIGQPPAPLISPPPLQSGGGISGSYRPTPPIITPPLPTLPNPGVTTASLSCAPDPTFASNNVATVRVAWRCENAIGSVGLSKAQGATKVLQTGGSLVGMADLKLNATTSSSSVNIGIGCVNPSGTLTTQMCSVDILKPNLTLTALPASPEPGSTFRLRWLASQLRTSGKTDHCTLFGPNRTVIAEGGASGEITITAPRATSEYMLMCDTDVSPVFKRLLLHISGSTNETRTVDLPGITIEENGNVVKIEPLYSPLLPGACHPYMGTELYTRCVNELLLS